jgi:dienelactone hydrolase
MSVKPHNNRGTRCSDSFRREPADNLAGLTDGTHLQDRGEHFPTIEHLTTLSREQLQADIATACSHPHAPQGGDCRAIVPLGFCIGGRLAFLCAASRDVTGVIGFYRVPGIAGPYGPGPTQHAHELRGVAPDRCPLQQTPGVAS